MSGAKIEPTNLLVPDGCASDKLNYTNQAELGSNPIHPFVSYLPIFIKGDVPLRLAFSVKL